MARLDEMDLNEISVNYKSIFYSLLSDKVFDEIKIEIEKIYEEYITYINKKYKVKKGTFGRGELKWGRNMIWGWYIELLIKEVLIQNNTVKKVDFLGGDSSHKFNYNAETKIISVDGVKNTQPDFLIELKNGKSFCIELKTAAAGVFSVKKGNVQQLYMETAYNNRITIIMMIDLENQLYSLENLNYFNLSKPFVNQRMEGQLCYHFPSPEDKIEYLTKQDFNEYLDDKIFNLDSIKKLKALKKAEDINDKRFIKIIKNKISIEKKIEERDLHLDDMNIGINKIETKYPEVNMSWDEIYTQLGVE
jgi:hypothetical protein